jgi:hypothetical protein
MCSTTRFFAQKHLSNRARGGASSCHQLNANNASTLKSSTINALLHIALAAPSAGVIFFYARPAMVVDAHNGPYGQSVRLRRTAAYLCCL